MIIISNNNNKVWECTNWTNGEEKKKNEKDKYEKRRERKRNRYRNINNTNMNTYMNQLNRVYDMNIAFLSSNDNYLVMSKPVSCICCFYQQQPLLLLILCSFIVSVEFSCVVRYHQRSVRHTHTFYCSFIY